MTYRTEFHCHTVYSKDSLVTPEQLIKTCRRKGIDRVIITDHNNTRGAIAAWKIAPELVVIGEEIMTTKGEILAAYLIEEIPPNLSPLETIKRLRAQGAFISIAHPFDTTRHGHWQEEDLFEILPLVDAIETFNARCLLPSMNEKAENFAKRFKLPSTVGSDAHSCFELGRATLTLPKFNSAHELRAVIRQGRADTRRSGIAVRVASRYAVIRKKIFFAPKETRS
jgi:predicted metal-dependent phosphoesterase TrpH